MLLPQDDPTSSRHAFPIPKREVEVEVEVQISGAPQQNEPQRSSRQAIVSSEGIRSSTKEAEKWPGVSSSAVRDIRRRAHKRADRTRSGGLRGKPLADISNCISAPRPGAKKKLTKAVVDQIVEKVTRNSVEPCKLPIVHIEELGRYTHTFFRSSNFLF